MMIGEIGNQQNAVTARRDAHGAANRRIGNQSPIAERMIARSAEHGVGLATREHSDAAVDRFAADKSLRRFGGVRKKNLCLCTPLHYNGRQFARNSATKPPLSATEQAIYAWKHVFRVLGHTDRKSREPQYVRYRAAMCCALFGRYSGTELARASGYDRATIYYHARMHSANMRYYSEYADVYARVCEALESLYT